MTPTDFFLLVAVIYAAPHVPKGFGVGSGATALLLALASQAAEKGWFV